MKDSEHLFALAHGWRHRGVAIVRLAFFAAVFFGAYVGLMALLRTLTGARLTNGEQTTSLSELLMVQGAFLLAVLAANASVLVVCRARPEDLGVGSRARGRSLAWGAATGLVLMTALIGGLGFMGFVELSGPLLPLPEAVENGAAFALMFVMVAFTEQGLMRGYALVQLSRALSFWPAALILSALFALGHLGNAAESWIGAVMAGIFGLICAYSFRRSGALWFAIGFHASWDYAQTFLFGVPDSGRVAPGALERATLVGNALWSGGAAGPEGSVFALIAMLALLIVVLRLDWRRAPERRNAWSLSG